jgi:hypothetical protein
LASDEALNTIRKDVILALNDVINSLQARTLTQEKIDNAKKLGEAWIMLLKRKN